ncbi:MAG: carbohydrate binding domain-containing protein, partial [Candidatus Latescibacteria bacterium]|nr:carbohydrate binding domain-containing protein [Candidatus Latescibacterota bacterium]
MAEENLVPNGGFEEMAADGLAPAGWSVVGEEADSVEWRPTRDAHGGERAFLVELPRGADCSVVSPEFPVSPKATYHVSVWARSHEPASLSVQLAFDSHTAGTNHYDASPKIDPEWKEVTGIVPSFPESRSC